jgi:hypothetical protein
MTNLPRCKNIFKIGSEREEGREVDDSIRFDRRCAEGGKSRNSLIPLQYLTDRSLSLQSQQFLHTMEDSNPMIYIRKRDSTEYT